MLGKNRGKRDWPRVFPYIVVSSLPDGAYWKVHNAVYMVSGEYKLPANHTLASALALIV